MILFWITLSVLLGVACSDRGSARYKDVTLSRNDPAIKFAIVSINYYYASKGDYDERVLSRINSVKAKGATYVITVTVDNRIKMERCTVEVQSRFLLADKFSLLHGPNCSI